MTAPLRSVLHVVVAGEVGGAERMLCDLAAPVEGGRDHAVALLTSSDRLRGLFSGAGLDVVDGGPAREDPVSFLRRSLGRRELTWLRDVVRRRDRPVVHLHTFGSQVLGTRAALLERTEIVRTEHSTRVYDDPSCWPFARWSLARADRVVCISEHVRAVAVGRAPSIAARARVVYNGIATDRFAPLPPPPPSPRLRLALVGRLEPRKGVDVAIDALRLLPDVELRVVGDGEDRARLERRARDLGGRVTFLGYADDVRDTLAWCDALVVSSRKEGLGIAAIEAMASARPVVSVPRDALPEIVRDGERGWLAHGTGPGALARVIADARDAGPDERARRGAAAAAYVRESLSVEAMRAGYEAVYRELDEGAA
ncbi:MAG: glycosyltransferase family 4 protein [Myxococcales bacterium]|nr:glycosyltransferase family 4 protein [Myxococcales bacterium]